MTWRTGTDKLGDYLATVKQAVLEGLEKGFDAFILVCGLTRMLFEALFMIMCYKSPAICFYDSRESALDDRG